MNDYEEASLFGLEGKIALVTGGNRGLGRGMAEALASQGADIALIGRSPDRLSESADQLRRMGVGVWTYVLDLEDHDAIPDAYARICSETGGVDILVNNAAVPYRAPAEDVSLTQWQRMLDIGLTSAMLMSQYFARERINGKRPGKVINIGSLMGTRTRPHTAAYTAMKAGLHGMTRSHAVEWATYGIQVNTLAPGFFVTDLTRPLVEDDAFDQWVCASNPTGRWGIPSDLAGAVVFFASRASDFVTGQILYIDGGWSAAL